MDIATYGVGLFTPTILGAIEISALTRRLVARDFALAERSALIDLFLLIGFLLGVLMVPRVRPDPNTGHWFYGNGCGHVDVTGSCRPNELEFAHSVRIRRTHSVQPADERWS